VKNVIGRDARAVDKLLEQFADFFRPWTLSLVVTWLFE
jgi:hypothetical protein